VNLVFRRWLEATNLLPMTKPIQIVLASFFLFAFSTAFAADQPASEASIKQLLEVSQVHKLLDSATAQMDALMKQAMQQVTQGQPVTPEVQKQIERGQSEAMSMMKEILDWNKLEPMYVRIYQKSFSEPEIDSLIAMYKSPAGQMLLTKMPVVLQNTTTEVQQLMQPVMMRIQRLQQDVLAQIQAEKAKKGG
jgi:hypothetical protein